MDILLYVPEHLPVVLVLMCLPWARLLDWSLKQIKDPVFNQSRCSDVKWTSGQTKILKVDFKLSSHLSESLI